MSLIDSLRNWGESLFASKKAYIAAQAMPGNSSISINVSAGARTEYTTPSDGYVNFQAKANKKNVVSWLQVWGDQLAQTVNANLNSSDELSINLPFKKGAIVYLSNGGGLVNLSAKFVYLVGGGLTAFLRWLKRGFGEAAYA